MAKLIRVWDGSVWQEVGTAIPNSVTGGTAGQALTKINSTDYNTQWTTIPLLTTANTFTGGVQQITTASAATKGLIVKATASQTANLQEWQDSAGTALSFIRSDGFARLDQGLQFGTMYSNTGSWSIDGGNSFKITQASAAYSPLIVKGAASQTADLQQWQNSAGAAIVSIDRDGQIRGLNMGIGGTSVGIAYVRFSNDAGATGALTFAVRGIASQTGDLQQWQNSAGTALTRIDSTGALRVETNTVLNNTQTGGVTAIIKVNYNDTSPLIVQGAASQTADLQQWMNSSGTVLAKITASGALDATAITVNGAAITTGPASSAVSSNITMAANNNYFVNTSAARTLTLPASPTLGDTIAIYDASGTAATNNITIARNGSNINGVADNAIIDVNQSSSVFIYTGATVGWRFD